MSEVIYVLTTIFFLYVVVKYYRCSKKRVNVRVKNCFDNKAEDFLNIIDSKDYEYH